MNLSFRRVPFLAQSRSWLSVIIALALFAAPLLAQRPTTTLPRPQVAREAAPRVPEPTFDTLLSADTYKLYGEVRNVGQFLTTSGVGEIVDPIIKFAGPPQGLQSMVKFLKQHAEELAASRLLFAAAPVRNDVPEAFFAIEFATPEEAARFSPKLEKFLPTLLPPPVQPESKATDSSQAKPGEPAKQPTNETGSDNRPRAEIQTGTQPASEDKKPKVPAGSPNSSAPAEQVPLVMSHRGNLVFISDKPFKFEKLHRPSSALLAEDQNFRIARDRFSAEPVFFYFNVVLEEKPQPTPAPPPKISEEEKARIRAEEEARRQKESEKEIEVAQQAESNKVPLTEMVVNGQVEIKDGQPTPKETMDHAQREAFNQIGRMFETIASGQPQWPDAVGAALALENNEYVLRVILIEPAERKKAPVPFVPKVLSGPAFAADVPSVLPDDTEVFVSASIDLAQTYEGMRKEAERKAKANVGRPTWQRYEKGVLVGQGPPQGFRPDAFAEFEQKAGFKIKDDLLPALGNEIAVAASLQAAQGLGLFGPSPPKPSPSPGEAGMDQKKKGSDVFPMLLIAVKDRDAARRLIPHVLNGLGIGEINMIAQVEKHDDAEIVSYGGMFAYALVGNFVVISEAATVRHVVDAYTNHQTLSGNSVFRNFTRWQPRQTLGQVYVSPALMDSYREQLTKQAPKMDQALRDLLMSLSPAPQAISYSLSNEGFGALHELHLPKDLVIAMVAGTSAAMSAFKEGSPEMNEMIAISMLRMIANAEGEYRAKTNSTYGSLDDLINQKLIEKGMLDEEAMKRFGYRLDVIVVGDDFRASATPIEYGKTGYRSFFVDKSGVVRGDDHGGGPATVSDRPVQ